MQRYKLLVSLIATGTVAISGAAQAATSHGPQRIEHVPSGTEWVAGHAQTLPSTTRAVVAKTFAQRYGVAWTERRHGPNGSFVHLFGEGIPVPAEVMTDAATALEVAKAFFADNHELLPAGVGPEALAPLANTLSRGVRLVSFQQTHHGLPVLGASAFVAIKQQRLVWVGVRCLPVTAAVLPPRVGVERATSLAREALAVRGVEAEVVSSTPALFPRVSGEVIALEPVQAVELRATGQGRWTAYVSAAKEELIALRDERLFFGASINLEHHDRHPPAGLIQSPAAHIQVSSSAGSAYTDVAGAFDAEGGVDLAIQGRYTRITNLAGSELSARLDGLSEGQSFVWSSDGSEEQQAQLDAYRFVTDAREHAHALAPEVSWIDRLLRVNVNYDDVCNAWFDGDLTFLRAGEYQGMECNNSAMIADIVYHEFGHGFHMGSAVAGIGGMDDAASEAFADYFAASITGDPQIAPHLMIRGGYLRDLRPDRVWPDDATYDPHETGLILGGALWDLRLLLQEELGEVEGADVANQIFAGMMPTTGDIASAYEAALLADDDNGNLADGTPHICTIDAAFGAHGLKSGAVAPLNLEHAPVTLLTPDEATPVELRVSETNTQCMDALVGNARLVFSADAGATWQTRPLTRGDGELFTGALPAMAEGTTLRYRIEVDEPLTQTVISRPANPAEPYFQVYVGALEELVFDDLETFDAGWSHRLIAGAAGEGADDWQRGTPGGVGGDPGGAFSGSYAWGNDLGIDATWNGQYQSSKRNALTSPSWDVSGHEQVRLQFRRWLSIEDGRYDTARVYVNDQMVWHNAIEEGQLHHIDREWVLVDLDISAQVAATGNAQITWELESDGGMEFGGWTIDDVGLYTVAEAGAGSGDGDGLTSASDDGTAGDGTPGRLIGCGCAQARAGDGAALVGLALFGLLWRRRACR